MSINFSTKERYLLEDQKSHEEICIKKYTNYSRQATDQQLKDIFNNHAKIEQEHWNTLNQLLTGQMPAMNNQQSGGSSNQQQTQGSQAQNTGSSYNSMDKDLCTDMLMTEKYVSDAYNTSIFEIRDTQVRDILNHIQKEEQKHGEAIFKYMESKGMYNVK
jgi:spore coat protein CotF